MNYANTVAARWRDKTKPPGSLGRLEWIAERMADIQQCDTPRTAPAALLLFAGDHGVHSEGVSPYPQAVTAQMVANIAHGGAASSVLAALYRIDYRVYDVGVAEMLAPHARIESCNLRQGSRNLRVEDAMTATETNAAIAIGQRAVRTFARDATVVLIGEMGIANSTSAAALTAALFKQPADEWVGAGTGLDAAGIAHKAHVVNAALSRRAYGDTLDTLETLAALGGFEIAAMVGAYLECAAMRKLILVDGFIATVALLVASRMDPAVLDVCIFSHASHERGHRALLQSLGASPLLDLGMRLGEGSGALTAYPLLVQSCALLDSMATFSQAAVTNRA